MAYKWNIKKKGGALKIAAQQAELSPLALGPNLDCWVIF